MATIRWVEGDTSQRVFTLTQEGVAFDLTDATVEVVLRPKAGSSAFTPQTYVVAITSAPEGKVGVSISTLKVAESPYSARFRVTKAGVTSYFPFPDPDKWEVIV
jgi:hypothetical protein